MNPTRQILDALARRHDKPRNGTSRAWVFAEEVRVGTGYRLVYGEDREALPEAVHAGLEQRIDAFALHTWPSKQFRRIAYEVKVSKSDLRRELEQPHKQEAALALSNLLYLVAPTDVLAEFGPYAIPKTWGILAYRPDADRLITNRRAPWRDTPLPPYTFMLSLARNLQQAQEAA